MGVSSSTGTFIFQRLIFIKKDFSFCYMKVALKLRKNLLSVYLFNYLINLFYFPIIIISNFYCFILVLNPDFCHKI